jgi:hypothetical protein
MNMGTISDIMEILNIGYGSQTTGPLDRAVAIRIISYFEDRRWMSPEEVAYLVDAAGGEIIVTREQLEDSNPLLTVQDNFETETITFRVRPDTSRNPKRTVNPEAESRNVDSGPIDLNITSDITE